VAGFLRELSDIDRDVLVLHACGELSHLELAQALAVEVGTVRSRLARARVRSREVIAGSGQVLGRRADTADDED